MKKTRRKEVTSENDIKIDINENGGEDEDQSQLTEERIQ
jgi:hypothetical protein